MLLNFDTFGTLLLKMIILVIIIDRLRAPSASAQNHSPLTTQLYLDHQSLMKKDDAVCSRLKLGGDDS
ncbi:unnamed protein product [Spirodela intermedia]|uniref:Uncharacterized protein n=2 Tax=Spirodela intermedia TaxID=51605 RepID=A0A7I8L6P6_SPIIN|nr:unnamed protein product [Spirodela intermedia]CAA6668581.1 unnamed protein product [Spirodela intermedia]CAA7405452.1 unnamed protein product [Spirodela intermedia]